MILTHHGMNSLSINGGSGDEIVIIGGREYRTVTMPDGSIWLAANLDYEWDNLPIGASGELSTPAGWYYNDQKNNYGIDGTYKCGLLYNGHAVDYLNNNKDTLIPGWHVATKAEWEALFAATGGWEATGPHLKASDHSITGTFPNNWNGTDDYEFGVLPGGYRGVRPYVSPFSSFGEWVCYWTGTELYSEQSYYVTFGDSTGPGESTAYKTDAYYVRLVKDAIVIGGKKYRTVKMPDGNTWLAENLDYKFDGCTFAPSGQPESPAAWYYAGIDDDRYSGLLYNWYAVKYLNDHKDTLLPPGWHVPTSSEYDTLFRYIDPNYVNSNSGTNNTDAGGKLKCLDYYDSSYFPTGWNGTDDYGFSVSPYGYYWESGFNSRNDAAYIWTADSIFTDNAKFLYFPKAYNSILTKNMHQKYGCSLRLVNTTATE